MEIEFLSQLSTRTKKDLWQLICKCDKEFIPPLSSRDSTSQTSDLSSNLYSKEGPKTYFYGLLNQNFIVAREGASLKGFLSFINGYSHKYLQGYNPSNYVTTICVDKTSRTKGVGKFLYMNMIYNLPKEWKLPYITTRTWSTNHNHIHILEKINFTLVRVIKNHRGEGIDTLYFAREI